MKGWYYRIILMALVTILVGLSCKRSQMKHDILQLWHGTNVALEQRVVIVQELVSAGARMSQVEDILGPPTRIELWHGPAENRASSPRRTRVYTEEERFIYEFEDGSFVCLCFSITGAPLNLRERPLTRFFVGRTNDIRFAPVLGSENQ